MARNPAPEPPNTLFYGDNLDILRHHVPTASVDLVYLDPPFNSNADYNHFFAEKDGSASTAQIQAFADTWEWGEESARAFHEFIEDPAVPHRAKDALIAFEKLVGHSDMLAYLAMMAPRLVELHRVLKPTGSLYLHCDPTASHYLKLLLDGVFGPKHFQNEISWKRSSAHNDTKQGMKRCGKIRDTLLFYSKGDTHRWNPIYTQYTAEYLASEYRHTTSEGRHYKETDLTAAKPGGDTEYEWRVKRKITTKGNAEWTADLDDEYLNPKAEWEYNGVPPYRGRFWAYSKANIVQFFKDGDVIHRNTGMPRLVQFADKMPGIALQDLWADIPPNSGEDDLGYPTQKPVALLERIIAASSNEGDIVLDPFCGCGTTVAAAHKLNRRWVGIDITYLAVNLIRNRLLGNYGPDVIQAYRVVGEPTDTAGAAELAQSDPYQFQWWALSRVGARAIEQKKGADKGIDGRLYFHDDKDGASKQVIFSVKAGGNLGVAMVRDLVGVLDREKAAIGVLIAMHEPTKPMRQEAASAGFYTAGYGQTFPRVQVLTIADLLAGKGVAMPAWGENRTFKAVARVKGAKPNATPSLPIPDEE